MGTLRHMQNWGTTHHPRWLIILRIGLGICLFIKGITFMSNTALLDQMLSGSPWAGNASWLAIAITWAHLLGGVMITVGLQTRWACVLQLPILIGAIIFINAQKGGFAAQSELGMAFLVLLLLIFFLLEGSGPLSLDNYFYKNRGKHSQGTRLP
jgi:putative oxidoreductase